MHREISTSFPSITAHTVKRLRTSLIEVSKHQESHEYKINWSPEGQDMKCILLQERTKGICLTFSTIAATLEYDALLYIRIFKGKSGRFQRRQSIRQSAVDERGFSTKSYTETLNGALEWLIQGRCLGGPGPLLFLDQLRPEGPKKKFGDRFPPPRPPALYLSVWMTGSIPLSNGLDPPLI